MYAEKKTTIWLVALLVVASLILGACARGAPAASESSPIKIGAVHDLTGATSDVGTPYADGLKAFVDWKNSQGGIKGRRIDLVSADYAYKVDQAEQLYTQFVQEGVVAFQGWGTGDTEALRARIATDKIPFMSASYSANLLNMEDAPYNFMIGTSYSDQALIALAWAKQDWQALGKADSPKVALIHHNSPFGQSPLPDAEAYAKKNGIGFASFAMPAGVTDYVAELAQIKQFGANYVIVHTVSSPAALLLKDAQNQGMKADIKFICLNWCADEIFVTLAGPAAEGMVGTIPFTPPTYTVAGHEEADKWLKERGSSLDAKGLHFTQGWWTMAVMVEGIERVIDAGKEVNGENIKAALETIQNFDTKGITAPISFSSSSHKGNSALRMYVVKDGKWNQLSDFISANP